MLARITCQVDIPPRVFLFLPSGFAAGRGNRCCNKTDFVLKKKKASCVPCSVEIRFTLYSSSHASHRLLYADDLQRYVLYSFSVPVCLVSIAWSCRLPRHPNQWRKGHRTESEIDFAKLAIYEEISRQWHYVYTRPLHKVNLLACSLNILNEVAVR